MFASVRDLAGKTIDEPIKIAIHLNRFITLFKATVHVIPVGVALIEIYLNWHEAFLRINVKGLKYLQFAVKAHELIILVSLNAMMFSYVRYELISEKDLSFDAFMSGF